jgi:hypothetical protein
VLRNCDEILTIKDSKVLRSNDQAEHNVSEEKTHKSESPRKQEKLTLSQLQASLSLTTSDPLKSTFHSLQSN